MKILYTITLALVFMFTAFFMLYIYGVSKKKTESELDGLLTGCAVLFVLAVFFGSLSLAAWIVF